MLSSEPARNTEACTTASRSGFTPSSGGMSGKTAAPSGTSASAGISASGHGGDDAHLVAILDGRLKIIQVANVLVIEVDVHKAAHLAVLKNTLHDGWELPAQVVEGRLDCDPGYFDDGLAIGVLPHWGRNMNSNRHDFSAKNRVHVKPMPFRG